MGSNTKTPRAATVEDCDDEDEVVRGTKKSASTKARSKGAEKSSIKSRGEVVKIQTSSIDKESRRKSMSATSARSPTKPPRPLPRNNGTSPPKIDTQMPLRKRADPSYFGVSPNASYTPNSSSARSPRPKSYYGGMAAPIQTSAVSASRPPIARSAYFTPPSPVVGISYPPPSPAYSYVQYTPELPWPNPLAERFTRGMDPITRTTSAQGTRALMDQSGFEIDPERRNSVRRRVRDADDISLPIVPVRRQSVTQVMEGHDPYNEALSYDFRPARPLYREPSPARRASRRPSVNRSSTYDYVGDHPNHRTETSNQTRRSSYYEAQPRASSDYEEKYNNATSYQEKVTGGPPVSLTAEALRKQELTSASSRSTRSSGSHDESDFKRSATTRTTTSRVEDGEDFVIRFKGSATVNIGGAEIKCEDGAEVNIVRSKGAIRNGSEKSASEYDIPPANRRNRDRRPSINSRSTSKSSYSYPQRSTWI